MYVIFKDSEQNDESIDFKIMHVCFFLYKNLIFSALDLLSVQKKNARTFNFESDGILADIW